MINQEKQEVKEGIDIGYVGIDLLCGSLQQVSDNVLGLQDRVNKKFPELANRYFRIDIDINCEDLFSTHVELYGVRLETNEERADRIHREKEREERKAAKKQRIQSKRNLLYEQVTETAERALLAELKAKYEP